jgi:hypothetical protein
VVIGNNVFFGVYFRKDVFEFGNNMRINIAITLLGCCFTMKLGEARE